MDIVGKRKIYLTISAALTVLLILSMIIFGFKLSIEFTGGSKLGIASIDGKSLDVKKIESIVNSQNITLVSIDKNSDSEVSLRMNTITDAQKNRIIAGLEREGVNVTEKSFDTLGPVIGRESRNNAFIAIALAIVAITLYIAFAFRKVSQPVSSWKFGISAIIALAYDVIFVLGSFALFGYLFKVEIDTLFITAILTIMGFSVHDTIVVFDRIRENLIKNVTRASFGEIVNKSFNETLARSLNTTLTVVVVLFSLLLFGGESIRWFIVAFLVGIISGTYSSIFIASGILVEWHELDKKGFKFSKLIPQKRKK